MNGNPTTQPEQAPFRPAHLDAFGRLMVSIAELAAVAQQYTANHRALVAIEPDQDHRRAA